MFTRKQPAETGSGNDDDDQKKGDGPNVANLTAIAAAATTLVGVISGLAVAGILQRAQRNEGRLLAIAFALVVAAAVGWVIGWYLTSDAWKTGPRGVRGIGLLALLVFGGGLLVAIFAIIRTQGLTQRPKIEAQIGENASVTATVHASGLTADSRIVIYVDGLKLDPETPDRYSTVRRIYQAFLGPDSDGDVNEPVTVKVPPSLYTAIGVRAWTTAEEPPCEFEHIDATTTGTRLGAACVILPLPRVVARPQLVAAWGRGTERRTLHVTAMSTQAPSARLVVLRVVAPRKGRRSLELARLLAEPDADGKSHVETSVAVPGGVKLVCADARFVNPRKVVPRVQCPANRAGPTSAFAQLALP